MTEFNSDALQELLDDGLSIEEAKNIIQASLDKDIEIQSDLQIEEKIQEISNVSEQQKRTGYLKEKDIHLLLKILNNIIQHPKQDKYKSINLKVLSSKMDNYDMCIDILKQCGFNIKKLNDDDDVSRLVFDNNQYEQLQSVYFNLSMMHICDYNEYTFDCSQNLNQLNSKHLLKPDRLYCFDEMQLASLQSDSWRYYVRKMTLQLMGCLCELQQCVSLKNIVNVLLFYNSYIEGIDEVNEEKNDIEDMSVFESVYSNINDHYNDTHLLNDFNHLLSDHIHEFEHIHNTVKQTVFDGKDCNLSNCRLIRRNYRDRSNKNDMHTVYQLYPNKEEIVSEQLLDHIHCHIFHTFDIGYKLTEKDRVRIIELAESADVKSNDEDDMMYDRIISNMSNLIETKRQKYRQLDELHELNQTSNKFTDNNSMDPFSYGYRYFYWSWYKNKVDEDDGNLSDFYVQNVFNNLKEEALFNTTCCINQTQWLQLVNKAQIHLETQMVRAMQCHRRLSAKYYDMQYGDLMAADHLIALMLYCNYDLFSFEFSKTYRKLDKDEDDICVKERHSMYYWLGRSLKECVECFGMKRPDTEYMTLYHGTNKYFTFCAMNAFISGPLSTTTDYAVAVNFCNNQGMILELSVETNNWTHYTQGMKENNEVCQWINCVDMSWISDFANEQEIFCLGGQRSFAFVNITKALNRGVSNYRRYVNGLRRMLSTMTMEKGWTGNAEIIQVRDTNTDIKTIKLDKQIAFRLLSHQVWKLKLKHKLAYEFKSCPEYIKNVLDINCKQVNGPKLHDAYFKYENGWINAEIITSIFPNVIQINLWAMNKTMEFWKNLAMFESVLTFLHNNNDQELKLKRIMIHMNYSLMAEFIIYMNKYMKDFESIDWKLTMGVRPPFLPLLRDKKAQNYGKARWDKFKSMGEDILQNKFIVVMEHKNVMKYLWNSNFMRRNYDQYLTAYIQE